MTPKQLKALKILYEHPDIHARAFGLFYFDQPENEYLYTAVSKQGNGACSGKKLWLCAGSLLGKLQKKGWVYMRIHKDGHCSFRLTLEGKKLVESSSNG